MKPLLLALTLLQSGYGYVLCSTGGTYTWIEGGTVCHANEADRVPWTQPRPREPYNPFCGKDDCPGRLGR
ncbi:hypothetical protein [Bradyrhizobium sp.]